MAHTDALMSRRETGKMAASVDPRYDRLTPGVASDNAEEQIAFQTR